MSNMRRPLQQGEPMREIRVPVWLALTWMDLKAKQFHGHIQVNFTRGTEANANVLWSIFPGEAKR